jgi:hypothetical protein
MYCYKERVTIISGMLAAMSIGMTVGFGGDIIAAILMPLNMLSTSV